MNVPDMFTAFLLRPLALAGAAWLLLRIFGIRHPASKHAVWTAVLAATLLLPPLTLIAPKWTLRILPEKPLPVTTLPDTGRAPVSEPIVSIQTIPEPAKSQTPQRHWPTPRTLTIWLYFAGLIAMLAYRLIAWIVLRKITSRAKRIHRFVYQSDDVLTPATGGVLQPSIILPEDWRTWPTETRRAALAHEYAHISRHDTLTLALTRFATCVYWFYPLAWWLARHISDLAELSCDAAVLEKSGDAKSYSRILLTFAEKVTEAKHRIALPRMAFATASGMSRRIDRIFELSSGNLRKLSRPRLLLALSGLPLTCLIATVGLGSPILHYKPAQPKLLAQSTPAPANPTVQSIPAPAPNVQPSKSPQRLEALSSFTPTDSENAGDALVVNGTLSFGLRRSRQISPSSETFLLAQSAAPPASRAAQPPAVSARSADPPLAFDAASVKVTDPRLHSRGYGIFTQYSPTTLTIRDISMWMCVRLAYGVENFRIAGPDSMQNPPFYDIVAKAASPVPESELRLMLRKLLADRFHLTLHWEKKEMSVTALLVAKGGSKIHPTTGAFDPNHGDDAHMQNLGYDNNVHIQRSAGTNGNVRFTFTNASMALFATWLESSSSVFIYDKAPVVDLTGMQGRFDWVVDSPLVQPPSGGDGAGTPVVADGNTGGVLLDHYKPILERELGLTLGRRKAIVDILVIDHVDKEPTSN